MHVNNEQKIGGGTLGIHFYGPNDWKEMNWFSKSWGEEEVTPAARSNYSSSRSLPVTQGRELAQMCWPPLLGVQENLVLAHLKLHFPLPEWGLANRLVQGRP